VIVFGKQAQAALKLSKPKEDEKAGVFYWPAPHPSARISASEYKEIWSGINKATPSYMVKAVEHTFASPAGRRVTGSSPSSSSAFNSTPTAAATSLLSPARPPAA
jgi:hypothetical protein